MISKSKIKLIRSLDKKKARTDTLLFVAEGHKTVEELLPTFSCAFLAATADWLTTHVNLISHLAQQGTDVQPATTDEICKASLLIHPQDVIALFRQKKGTTPKLPENELCLALDNIQDPGNLGTIIRIADWFGINHIYCSPDSADLYSPKTVQATMGAMAHVDVCRTSLPDLISHAPHNLPVYGTFLDGDNIYRQQLPPHALIVLGNEGNGISKQTADLISRRLLIPNLAQGRATIESLNVAAATAVVCSEFRRQASRF